MADTFTWKPTKESKGSDDIKVKRTGYGDGYEQTSPDGINSVRRGYDLLFVGQKEYIEQIIAFLKDHVGVSFVYTPSFGGVGYFQISDSNKYDYVPQGGNVWTLSFSIKEQFGSF